MDELQIGLIILGLLTIVIVVAYNKLQERNYRRDAEKNFGPRDTRDVLLETPPDKRPLRTEPSEMSTVEVPEHLQADSAAEGKPARGKKKKAAAAEAGEQPRRSARARQSAPAVPERLASKVIDCAIRIEAIEALEVARLWAAKKEQLQRLNRQVWWFAFDDEQNDWIALDADTSGSYHWFCAVLQLVDRQGSISEAEFAEFAGGVQCVADQFLAVPVDLPSRASTLARADELDRFCASVDVQVGINILANSVAFNGVKIRTLAESSGLLLRSDGRYYAEDENRQELFSLLCMDGTEINTENLQTLQVNGLTLLLDVPLVAGGADAFDRMMRLANLAAHSLGGNIVDDNRTHFGPEAAAVIRGQIEQFQEQMGKAGIEPGGKLATRLFGSSAKIDA